jgi:glyceraldehyde 3-phosphate dehydrogenase
MKKRLAINGFGRIGRSIAKINFNNEDFDLIAINDTNPYLENMAYLFKYDSTYGVYPGSVSTSESQLIVSDKCIAYSSHSSLTDMDWDSLGIDIIIDASGVAANIDAAKQLVNNSNVENIIITHSTDKSDKEIIMGVNEQCLTKNDHVISNSICDANAIAHVLMWLDNEYLIETGSLTTLHPWLSYQNLTDSPSISQNTPGSVWQGFSLGRSSTNSLIPKNTTAMSAIEKALPQLQGKIMSFSYRIPTNIVATADITLKLVNTPSTELLKNFLTTKAENSPFVRINEEPLVSIDYENETHSCVIDMPWLKVENGLVKIVLWYDNEWGYRSRTIDLAKHLSEISC